MSVHARPLPLGGLSARLSCCAETARHAVHCHGGLRTCCTSGILLFPVGPSRPMRAVTITDQFVNKGHIGRCLTSDSPCTEAIASLDSASISLSP